MTSPYRQSGKKNPAINKLKKELRKKNILINNIKKEKNRLKKELFKLKIEKKKKYDFNISAVMPNTLLLSNIAHEIRTPMNAILGFVEILERKTKDSQQKEYLGSIKSAANSMMSMINDIIDLFKAEAKKLSFNYIEANIVHLIQDIMFDFPKNMTEKNIDFHLDFASNFPNALLLDEDRLHQVLEKLIGNAVKYADTNQIRLKAGWRHSIDRKNSVDILIIISSAETGAFGRDSSPGFEYFDKTSRDYPEKYDIDYETAGLGLALAKQITELMGGKILFQKKDGVYNAFMVCLKNIRETGYFKQHKDDAKLHDVEKIKFGKSVILIADDMETVHKVIKLHLNPYDFTFLDARDGKTAINIAKKHRPDIILLDVKMPGLSGDIAVQAIKSDPGTKHIPVIAVTGSSPDEIDETISGFYDGFLQKPFSMHDLVFQLAKFIPYTTDYSCDSENNIKSSYKNKEMENLPISGLTGLTKELDGELYQVWKELCDVLFIDDIEKFGKKVKQVARKFNYHHLEKWADRLTDQAAMFDMEELPKTLKEYKEIIKTIKLKISS